MGQGAVFDLTAQPKEASADKYVESQKVFPRLVVILELGSLPSLSYRRGVNEDSEVGNALLI